MVKKQLILLILVAMVAASIGHLAAAKKTIGPFQVYVGDLDGNEVTTFSPGDTVYVWVENLGFDAKINYEVMIVDPKGTVVARSSYTNVTVASQSRKLIYTWDIPNGAMEGTYAVTLRIYMGGESYQDSVYFDVMRVAPGTGGGAETPLPQQPEKGGISPLVIAVIALVAVGVIGVVAYFFMQKSKASQAAPASPAGIPPVPPPSSPQMMQSGQPNLPPPPVPTGAPAPGGGETVVVSPGSAPATGGGETLTALAKLVAPNGKVIPITSLRQSFGREDFAGLVPPDQLRMISRRSKPHFEIFFDPSRRAWFIVDNASSNGTYVNGQDIRGMGPVELKPGDKISPAGVIELTFQV